MVRACAAGWEWKGCNSDGQPLSMFCGLCTLVFSVPAEILFLLYGVYLCFTVRKAPANFNESKHITWAVYNAIVLGSFMTLFSYVHLNFHFFF